MPGQPNRPSSQITFLKFQDMVRAKRFFRDVLGLETAYDAGWAVVYATADQAFVGAVDAGHSSDGDPEGVGGPGILVSFTVDDVEAWHAVLSKTSVQGQTEIHSVPGIGLRSFFFQGPEGYRFEVQEFTDATLRRLF